MSSYLSVAVLAGCIILALVLFSKLKRLIRAEKELEILRQNNEKLVSRLDSIVETQEKISEIQNEKAPEKKKAPPSGDSSSRLDRLNSMQKQ